MTRSLIWVPNGLKSISNFLQPDWLINNGFFERPIMMCTLILVHRWGPRTRISPLFTDVTNWGLIVSARQATFNPAGYLGIRLDILGTPPN